MNLHIAHLYPDLLNLYGDRGNVQCMAMRCRWRGIDAHITQYCLGDRIDFARTDIVLLGGGSDREQHLVCAKLQEIRADFRAYVEDGGAVLAICGGYQLLGHYYDTPQGRMQGLSLCDIYTEQGSPRLISDVVLQNPLLPYEIVGFENHGGRTYLGAPPADGDAADANPVPPIQALSGTGFANRRKEKVDIGLALSAGALRPLGKVLYGHGNNGRDGREGMMYRHVIGTYLHGPLLPKNPHVCDLLLSFALEKKYGRRELAPLDDRMEIRANREIRRKFI